MEERSYATPVSKDGFFCSGPNDDDFYVEIDGKNRHPRATVSHLEQLLKPATPVLLTKAGKPRKRQPQSAEPPIKDQVGHWYSAQLLHYGLKPSNTKATAKKRLLAALDEGTLEVPEDILQLEEELRALYHEANEVAKAKHDAGEQDPEQDELQGSEGTEEEEPEEEGSEGGDEDDAQRAGVFEEITGATSFAKACKIIEEGKKERLKVADYTGLFEICCPTVVAEWPDMCDADSLVLELGVHGKALWGKYDLGMYTGIIQFSRLPTVTNEFIPCLWRGRENAEGQMSFGDSCTGKVAFLPGRKLAGTINAYGDLAFAGTGVPSSKISADEIKGWKAEWEEFTEEKYEEENRARWG
ncbi:hypothetical protein BOTBODRAFT_33284 [Botryobasidium botryosum FD-172 SS1]|uniref:Uncharacterized protein n=1 Tax=Botryobasidium botryosum (strain FD-172 SS1) TaxID=930990 RepID=A0A067MQK1_BOTB1|nr:hypothetical protein BOTBODRAFT_33284 [Botryobasidium botryosum FD-172 SS1]